MFVCVQKLQEADLIFFPINISNTHWSLAVVYAQKQKIRCFCVRGMVQALSVGECTSLVVHLRDASTDVYALFCRRYFDSFGLRNTKCLSTLEVNSRCYLHMYVYMNECKYICMCICSVVKPAAFSPKHTFTHIHSHILTRSHAHTYLPVYTHTNTCRDICKTREKSKVSMPGLASGS